MDINAQVARDITTRIPNQSMADAVESIIDALCVVYNGTLDSLADYYYPPSPEYIVDAVINIDPQMLEKRLKELNLLDMVDGVGVGFFVERTRGYYEAQKEEDNKCQG